MPEGLRGCALLYDISVSVDRVSEEAFLATLQFHWFISIAGLRGLIYTYRPKTVPRHPMRADTEFFESLDLLAEY